ncbi:radical SAM protein [Nitrobacter sp.]|uniref:radical SAM protein n=1 Tax=Nitrobacter sp. TaxID=29420 RepID=UPI003F654144
MSLVNETPASRNSPFDESLLKAISPKILELIIFPTEKCNFRCTYCYEDFSIGKMKPKTIQAIKNLIDHRISELSLLKLAWFGGEPLLAKNIILDLCRFGKKRASEAASCDFYSSMTTNGYLLDIETAKELSSAGVWEYQITLDGPADSHDRTRPTQFGDGTYQRIWNNLVALRASDLKFSIILRLHFGPHNIEVFPAFISEIVAQFGNDNRFCVDLQGVQDWGGPKTGSFKTFSRKERADLLANFQALIDGHLPRAHDGPGTTICYAAKANSFVIRADGAIGKCTVALSDERNHLGRLADDGTMELRSGKLAPWMRGITTLDSGALSCPFGSMPQQWHSKKEENHNADAS